MLSGALTPDGISSSCPIRISGVSGYDGRRNDVVYCHPVVPTDKRSTVIFFGGDVQDFPENMLSHRDNKNYVKWNLENTAQIIQSRFPDSHIVVVRPSRMEYKTFSCFENFVPCGSCGSPDHTPNYHSLRHLEILLQSLSIKLREMSSSELSRAMTSFLTQLAKNDNKTDAQATDLSGANDWWKENIALDKYDLTLMGFSKGCVVLNQFLYEFHYMKTLTSDDATAVDMVRRIRDMYWLDGGHSGGKNTWITSRPLLETMSRLGIGVHVHVTPYQIQDERRPWIKKEEKTFSDTLIHLGTRIHRVVHFENIPPNLYIHFDVLTKFTKPY